MFGLDYSLAFQPVVLNFMPGAQPGHTLSFPISVTLDQILENVEEFSLFLMPSAGQPLVEIASGRNEAFVFIEDSSGRLSMSMLCTTLLLRSYSSTLYNYIITVLIV